MTSEEGSHGVFEIDRILPLGLTVQEAKAWYWHSVIIPSVRKGFLMTGFGLVIAPLMISPVGQLSESELTSHMILQHSIFIVSGFLLASGVDCLIFASSRGSRRVFRMYQTMQRANYYVNRRGIVAFVLAGFLTAYWNSPGAFDSANLNVAFVRRRR